MKNIHDQLMHELTCAEQIILCMLKHMTAAQKHAAHLEIAEGGFDGEGMTRYHERREAPYAATLDIDHAAQLAKTAAEAAKAKRPLGDFTAAAWRGATRFINDGREIGVSFDTATNEIVRLRMPTGSALDLAIGIMVGARDHLNLVHSERSSGIPSRDGSPAEDGQSQ